MNLIFSSVREAAGPQTHILALRYYDPFDFGTGLAFEQLADQTIRDMNERIAAAALRNGVLLADAHTLFRGSAVRLTHVLEGDVHPSDQGYGVLLLAFQDAYEGIGLFRQD